MPEFHGVLVPNPKWNSNEQGRRDTFPRYWGHLRGSDRGVAGAAVLWGMFLVEDGRRVAALAPLVGVEIAGERHTMSACQLDQSKMFGRCRATDGSELHITLLPGRDHRRAPGRDRVLRVSVRMGEEPWVERHHDAPDIADWVAAAEQAQRYFPD